MKSVDLKEGDYIKWKADRMFKAWDTYGKVLKLTEDEVSIETYDDFKKTTISTNGEALDEEISPATKEDVIDYLELSTAKLNTRLTELTIEYRKSAREIENKLDKIKGMTQIDLI